MLDVMFIVTIVRTNSTDFISMHLTLQYTTDHNVRCIEIKSVLFVRTMQLNIKDIDSWNRVAECLDTFTSFMTVYSIFIHLSRESDGGDISWMNSHSRRSCRFPSFLVDSLTSSQLICCLFEGTEQR